MPERYSIDEIRTYLSGCMYLGASEAAIEHDICLAQAVTDLEDEEDGIAAVTARRKTRENQVTSHDAAITSTDDK